MRPITTRTIACAAAVVVGAAPLMAARPIAHGDTPCTPPKRFATNWNGGTADGVTFQVPKGFNITGHAFVSGRRTISAGLNMSSAAILTNGELTAVNQCRTVITDRPVLITTYRATYEDAAMAPSGFAGTWYLTIAEFEPIGGSPEFSVWIMSPYRTDGTMFRQLFWSVHFPGDVAEPAEAGDSSRSTPPGPTGGTPAAPAAGTGKPSAAPCVRASPLPVAALETVVDTGLVSMLAKGAGPFPKGHGTMALQFDSTGTLSGLGMLESDLPASTQQTVGSLVTSNVRQRPAGQPATVLLRVSTDSTGFGYAMEASVNCPD